MSYPKWSRAGAGCGGSSYITSAPPLDFVDRPADGLLVAAPPVLRQCWGLTDDGAHPRPRRCCQYARGGVSGRYLTCYRHRRHEVAARRLQTRLRAERLKVIAESARRLRRGAAE